MKKFIKILFLFVLLISTLHVFADDTTLPDPTSTPTANINLTIRDGNSIIFLNSVPLEPAGTINLNDSNGNPDPNPLNADSVLSVINDAQKSAGFNINFIYEYGSVYMKCINSECGHDSVGWEYAVDGNTPGLGMDQYSTLKDGDNIYVYFGQNHQINLNASSITTADNLTVTAQNYHYQDNTWVPLTGITIGLTQPNPADAFNPTEIQTKTVDNNGTVTFSAIPAGSYNIGIKEDYYYPTKALIVTTPTTPVVTVSSGGGGYLKHQTQTKPTFDITKATNFLLSQQKTDGSFGEDLYTDWATLALASNTATLKTNLDKITKYFSENKFSGTNTTDYERHTMALMALGLNPYNTNNENYIKDIISKFDGTQFGDKNTDNDDIFALVVLQNAGYTINDKIISDNISFILSKQKTDGSWDESVDLTGAGIEALSSFNQNEKVKNALTKAEQYLKQNQKADGSWQNVSSTTWVMQGILALNEKPENWTMNNNTPIDYLATNQDADGGIKNTDLNNRIWQTAYTLTSLSGKTWNQIMQKFPIPIIASDETKTPALINSSIINPLQTTITNSYKNTFAAKIKKYIKPNQKIAQPATTNTIPTVKSETVKKQSFFRRILNKLFGF